MKKFTVKEKIACLERILLIQDKIYSLWLVQGKVKPDKKIYESELTKEILEDYKNSFQKKP